MWPAVLLWLHSLLTLVQIKTSSKGSNLENSYSNGVYSPSCMDLVIRCHNGCDVRSHFNWAVYTASSSHLLVAFPVNVTSFTSVSVTLVKKNLSEMLAPIPHLSFEGHKVAWKILERGLGFLLLTKNIIPLNASSASPDFELCVQRQHNSSLPSVCHLLGRSLTWAVMSWNI